MVLYTEHIEKQNIENADHVFKRLLFQCHQKSEVCGK